MSSVTGTPGNDTIAPWVVTGVVLCGPAGAPPGPGADRVEGGDGNDRLSGGWGRDELCGRLRNDSLTGGPGADLFVMTAGDGMDLATDFQPGVHRLQLDAALRGGGSRPRRWSRPSAASGAARWFRNSPAAKGWCWPASPTWPDWPRPC